MSEDTTGNRNTPDPDPQTTPPEGQSRRDLLKAAVVGSAAVAAVAGAGSAALALTGRKPVINLVGEFQSPGDPCAVCTSNTTPTFVDQNTFNCSENIFLWIRFINVPAGSYTVNVTPAIQDSSIKNGKCDPSTPFQYSGGGNPVMQWTFAAGPMACHPGTLPGGATNHDTISQVSFTVGSGQTKDLQVLVHLQNCAPTNQTVLVTVFLNKVGDGTIRQCTHNITIQKC
jgi:hypothetical protein